MMTEIDVVVVDDNEIDRYIVKRKLTRAAGFGDIQEAVAGDRFLSSVSKDDEITMGPPPPTLVLMDINMPRMNGFETVQRLQEQLEVVEGPPLIVVMMFTSSDNPRDRQRAEELPLVKGYICKPLDDVGIDAIRSIYASHYSSVPPVPATSHPPRPLA